MTQATSAHDIKKRAVLSSAATARSSAAVVRMAVLAHEVPLLTLYS